ncbi:type VI secretion system tip protein TssI/VgrG [Hahella sp. HN01]|uniref:type VI secretion system Vgr family protein n=1 Tax=Hahella sp. HN01 TaxID=2847262 RepID=UPI001C1EF6C2|nr:type VI secretion system tip protein TssI/VgrG [Hahella sp. HN01]MBU6951370.1 type VI secretion system tip protein VgrG [Hahella sp. HN01]
MDALFIEEGRYTQDTRPIRIDTPLGKDVFLLRHFRGQEGYSQLFQYDVDLLSHKRDIRAEDIIGELAQVTIGADGGAPRVFSGHVSYFESTGLEKRGLYGYKAVLVPWLWFLNKNTDCRVFQNMTAPKILEAVFTEAGFSDFRFSGLYNEYPELEYCVQYRESDLNFALRLMEQEGIYFYFEQAQKRHMLILADDKSTNAFMEPRKIEHSSRPRNGDYIQEWRRSYQYFSGKWSLSDFNFEKSDQSLLAECSALTELRGAASYERFDYPGAFGDQDRGRRLTKLRMEEEESRFTRVSGRSNLPHLLVGRKFALESEECVTDNRKNFVVTAVRHYAYEGGYTSADSPDSADKENSVYFNRFECLPDNVSFRPALNTPKPRIDGVQTAIVCGKSGDEIYTDEYGRIKVQFHWDRYGERNENSSCWVRVATPWAGKKWGSMGIPRVGQEVVTTFLEGDPDRPLVIGGVYNKGNMPPYSLPDNKSRFGVKSQSTKGGQTSNYNEISFDDKKGEESLNIHAEKDFNMEVKNNIGANAKGHSNSSVGGNASDSVAGNSSLSVGGDHSVAVTGKQNVSITGAQTHSVTGAQTLNVGADQTESVSGNITQTATNQTLNLSADHTISATNQKINLGAAHEVSASSQKFTISGLQTTQADAQTVTVTGKTATTATEIDLAAGGNISLRVGGTSIQINDGGVTITIGGSSIKVDGAGVSVSGPMIKLN